MGGTDLLGSDPWRIWKPREGLSQSSTVMVGDELGPLSEPSHSFPLACDGDFRTRCGSSVMGVTMNLGVDQRNPAPLEIL